MTRITGTALAIGVSLAFSGPALAQYEPISPTETGWVLRAEQGSCLAQKGADTEQRFQMTHRGRFLMSAPDLPDPLFNPGQPAQLTLNWSDGVVQQVNAAQLTLPGGGAQNLKPREVYVVGFDTTSLATRFPKGFTLTAFRGDRQVFSFDGRDGGDYLRAFNQCAAQLRAARR